MTNEASPPESGNNNIKKYSGLPLIIIGYVIIYAVLEVTAKLTGDTVKTINALVILFFVLVFAVLVETIFFKNKFSELVKVLGLGKPKSPAIIASLVITLILFLCYPLISYLTGYKFVLPENWLWLAVGVFALHGIAEEVLYRAYLFKKLRNFDGFWKAAWLAVLFFTAAHIPIILNQGLLVGGMAVLLAVVSSFPFALLYEKGGNTIWAPAIVHFAIDIIIPILAFGTMDSSSQLAVTLWMAVSMAVPYLAFFMLRKAK